MWRCSLELACSLKHEALRRCELCHVLTYSWSFGQSRTKAISTNPAQSSYATWDQNMQNHTKSGSKDYLKKNKKFAMTCFNFFYCKDRKLNTHIFKPSFKK